MQNNCECTDEKEKLDSSEKGKECSCNENEEIKEQTTNTDSSEESDCSSSTSPAEIEEDSGCACGCGDTEYPDQSTIENPFKPEFIAEEEFIKEFESHVHSLGIASVGYTNITPELLIKDKFIPYTQAIVLTMPMDEKIITTAPGDEAQDLNNAAYAKLGKLTYELSDYLRKHGFATQVAHPYEGIVNFSPLAQKAGIGWIGKSGLLISPELGPRQKISAILVSIVNLPEKEINEHSWISDYCNRCSKCIKACPEKALIEKEGCCGSTETELIQKQCIGCSQGCTYCIEDCPFYTKGYHHIKDKFDKMNAKLREKNKNCCGI